MIDGAAGLVSVFIEQPQFQGQTKEKLVSVEATRLVETIVGDHFDHWLTGDKEAGTVLLEHVDRQGRGAAAAQAGPRAAAQDRDAQAAPARQARRLHATPRRRHRDLPGRGRFGRRLGQAGAQPRDPGDPAAARQDPERRQRLGRQAAREPGSAGPDPGAGLRHRRPLQRRAAALRARHHHDRRRRRRRPHRLAADDVLLSRDAEADRERPPLPRPAAALPPHQGRQDRLRPGRRAAATSCCARCSTAGKVEISRFKGLGEMQSVHLRETTMDPAKRVLLKVDVPTAVAPIPTRAPRGDADTNSCRGFDGPKAREALRFHPGERQVRPGPGCLR